MAKERKGDIPENCIQTKEENGFVDPRFQTPVMAINLTADSVREGYQEHLKNGGDKIDS